MLGRSPKDAGTPPSRPGFLTRLRQRLNRGDSWLTRDLGELVRGRRIDAQILEELETRLITADVGVAATARIL
ncbi:MAG TPA: signal recognition particle receptor subunit alpha, partial [Steroidobacteraceae bacterium]|nr:signal recognition particle receptor subunit alpha [Steroidobacteraceae bacterium]